jgi:beta-glucosidase
MGFMLFTAQSISFYWEKEIHWDWSMIDLEDQIFWDSLKFPDTFQWGSATSANQIEGTQTCYNQFVENNWTIDPYLGYQYKNNNGTDHWNRYKEDVQLIKQLGMNAYRLSIPWEKIEPEEENFNQEAMDHYKDLCSELKNNGIEPWVCLFHFTIPVWFAEKGGFKEEKNSQYFIRFCTHVFKNLHNIVTYWATYNEPIVYVLEGYLRGTFPPREKSLKIAGLVMKNLLNAHVEIYQECKKINPEAQIGLIKMFHPLEPYNSYNPLEQIAAYLGNYLMHDTVLNFFKTGTFNWFYMINHTNIKASLSLDFIGVNYYCHELIQISPFNGIHLLKARKNDQTAPDNGKAVYPEGLYRAIEKAATLHLPIYITENGIADQTDSMRNEFIKKHIYVINHALENGYDLQGYFMWSLMDTLGWKKDYHSTYGLYKVDPATKDRILRNGAKLFVDFLHTKNSMPHIAA